MEKKKNKLLQNAMRTPDGTILNSTHVHDFITHEDKNGQFYANDGGLDYIKRSYPVPTKLNFLEKMLRFIGKYKHMHTPTDLSIYESTPFEEVREKLLRGSNGKFGEEKFHWVILMDMKSEWIKAAIKYNKKYHKDDSWVSDMYRKELLFRGYK